MYTNIKTNIAIDSNRRFYAHKLDLKNKGEGKNLDKPSEGDHTHFFNVSLGDSVPLMLQTSVLGLEG